MKIILAMIFVSFEFLSILFAQFFFHVNVAGYHFNVLVGVLFFCVSFFIIDLATEVFDEHYINILIWGKVISQLIVCIFGYIGIKITHLDGGQIESVIVHTPKMMMASIAASVVGYKITAHLMQKLKIKYHGEHLLIRYFTSVLPGEMVASFTYSFLFFFGELSQIHYFNVVFSLLVAKLVITTLFSILFKPIKLLLLAILARETTSPSLPLKRCTHSRS